MLPNAKCRVANGEYQLPESEYFAGIVYLSETSERRQLAVGGCCRLSTLGLATKTIKTVDRNSQQLVLPFVLSVFSIAVK